MSNTSFGNLKINGLRRWGSNFNANDATRLQMAGNVINAALGIIQGEIKGHPFTLDTNNTVTATITTPYKTDLVDTDIIELLSVQERVDPKKLVWIPYALYKEYQADPTRFSGTPNLYWTAVQSVNVSGQNIWSLLFVPTPSSAITIYYDYIKNLQFASDSTSADAAFSPLPTVYDEWIYAEAKPLFYEIIDPGNNAMIERAATQALEARRRYRSMIMDGADTYLQAQSPREAGPMIIRRVQTTPAP